MMMKKKKKKKKKKNNNNNKKEEEEEKEEDKKEKKQPARQGEHKTAAPMAAAISFSSPTSLNTTSSSSSSSSSSSTTTTPSLSESSDGSWTTQASVSATVVLLLPPGWVEFVSEGGIPYYYNEETQVTTWERPVMVSGDMTGGSAAVDIDSMTNNFGATDGCGGGASGGDLSLDEDLPGNSLAQNVSISFTNFVSAAMASDPSSALGGGGGVGPRFLEHGSDDDNDDSDDSDDDSDDSDEDEVEDELYDISRPSVIPNSFSSSGRGSQSGHQSGSSMEENGTPDRVSVSLRATEGDSKGRALMELLDSERRYIVVLQHICKISDWLQQENAMKREQHMVLFKSTDMLLDLSKGFIIDIDAELSAGRTNGEEVLLDEVRVGALLMKYMPFFKIYTVYSDAYDDKQAVVKDLMGDGSTSFAKQLRSAMEDNEVSGDFSSLLIQPIQRIPRYKMLLERIVKKSPTEDPDLPHLEKALALITGVADHVNLSLRRQEEQLKLLQLQNCFFPPITLVQPGRRLLRRAELGKIAEKNSTVQKYTFFLFNDALAYGAKVK
jgi:hypothetical protein